MSRSLALYNAHKRATLDRLRLTYQLQLRSVYRFESSHLIRPMEDALNAHHTNFNPIPPNSKLDDKLFVVFERFQRAVINAGFSDGIQEVSPEGKLNLWENHPINTPVEDTIILEGGVALAERRDKIADLFMTERERKLKADLAKYVANSKDNYLRNIRRAYQGAAKRWFNGERDVDDVKKVLRRALISTDSNVETVLRTETTNYFNETRVDYFESHTDVDYLQFYAVTDGRISNICEDRHGFCFPIGRARDKNLCPACHPNCRSVQRPMFSSLSSNKRTIEKYSEKSMDGKTESQWAPLPKGWG